MKYGWSVRLAALLVVALGVAHGLALDRVTDDAFITFRYARNLVDGHGLVFNPGERVEGYTNFLWTILLAGCHRVARDADLMRVAQALGLGCAALTIALVVRLSWRIRGERSWLGLLAPAFLALHTAFCAWTTSGLETSLFTLLVLAGCVAEVETRGGERSPWLVPGLFALATMTRPEGGLYFAAVLLHRVARAPRGARLRRGVAPCLLYLLFFGPYFAWRFAYYGHLLPNTFYAKVGGDVRQWWRGAHYVVRHLERYGPWLVLLPLPLLARRHREAWTTLFATVVAFGLAEAVAVGGEASSEDRFLVPLAPFFALLVQEGLVECGAWAEERGRLRSARTRAAAGAAALVVVLAGATWQGMRVLCFPRLARWREPQSGLTFPGLGAKRGDEHEYRWFGNYFVDRLAAASRWLDSNAPAGSVVAATPAGAIGWFMRHDLIDMCGLNDEHIAHEVVPRLGAGKAGHEKGDGAYVLSRRPDYLLLGNVAVFDHPVTEEEMERKLVLRSEHQIWADPGFHRDYELVHAKLADSGLFRWFSFYRRRSAVPRSAPH
jgi:hypothetical protein